MRGRLPYYRIIQTIALVIAGGLIAFAETPVYTGEPSGQFMRSWLVCGPFPADPGEGKSRDSIRLEGFYRDYLAAHGGEAQPQIVEGQAEEYQGVNRVWTRHDSPADAVDLDTAIAKDARVVGYAYCEIETAATVPCALALGSNDGAQVWLNGERVWDWPGGRGLDVDGDIIPVVLVQGRNKLLVKVEERSNLWQFACRMIPFDSELVSRGIRPFRIATGEDGVPHLLYVQSQAFLDGYIESVKLKAVDAARPDEIIWEGTWPAQSDFALPIAPSLFRECRLDFAIAFKGGLSVKSAVDFTVGKRVERTLFADGASAYRILVEDSASDSEKWAAQELQHWIRESGGVELPIVAKADDAGPFVAVGLHGFAKTLLPDEKTPDALDESFRYRNVDANIVIWGGSARGTMYGVMSFLERELGCRWYTPKVSSIPRKTRMTFVRLDHGEKPGIRVRNDFYHEAFEPIWAARNRINGAMGYREQPGGVEAYWGVHTFFPLVPPDEFFATHPEYYSLLDGKRTYEHAQLCLTNPDVPRIMTERILDIMRKNPQYLIYCVSQNDWSNPCECDACQAIVDREGSQSGPIIWFVNQVAEQVEKEFPDKFIGTLAYSYTRKPCATLKPRENVVVRFCSIECCFAHDFKSCPENKSFVEDMEGWAKISPHIYIWDYVVNFSHYIMPYPNFRVLQPNLQFFRDHNAIGIMEQAAYQSRGGEFAELRAYVIARLLWNPECDVEAAIADFMYGYYGRSGQYIRQYFDMLHGRLTPDTHIHLGLRPDDKLFTDDFVREAEAIFDHAEAVAESPEILGRVEMARLPIMYLKCKRKPVQAVADGTLERVRTITEREGVTHFAEAGEPHRLAFFEEVTSAE
ncbi:MAG: DUF4838 domain-containing protein [Candidatus Hydrogenedentes bacterium]|nr:DUF4838 domain-containing protein [Candidatus Hydrogenedentota bacterium]